MFHNRFTSCIKRGLVLGAVALTFIIAPLDAGFAKQPGKKEMKQFQQWVEVVAEHLKNDPSYKPLPLDTEDRADQFFAIFYAYYSEKIDRAEFQEILLEEYPKHKKSIKRLSTFTRNSTFTRK